MQLVRSVDLLIASNEEAAGERAAVRDALSRWNSSRGRMFRIVVFPWAWWEQCADIRFVDGEETIFDAQAIDRADIFLAVFNGCYGRNSGADVLKMLEELRRSVASGKSTHAYLLDEDTSLHADPNRVRLIENYKSALQDTGVLRLFSDSADLARQVIRDVESDIWSGGHRLMKVSAPQLGAQLQWRHVRAAKPSADIEGLETLSARRNDVEVRNIGSSPAASLTFTIQSICDPSLNFETPAEPLTVHTSSSVSWPLIATPSRADIGNSVRVSAQWNDSGQARQQDWTIALSE